MASGRHLLARIDDALSDARATFRTLDVEVQSNNAAMARNHRRQLAAYQSLAQHRLRDIEQNSGAAESSADRDAVALLERRETALETLAKSITENEAKLTELRNEEQSRTQELEDAESALEDLLESVDQQLANSASHQRLVDTAQKALDTVANATEKLNDAQAQRELKREPYDNDPLFSYLWDEGYGTSEYQGGLIKRFMDGVVARHVRFESARRNFFTLNEIPRQLSAHVAQLEALAAEHAQALADAEANADRDAGGDTLREAVDQGETALAATEQQIEVAQQQFAALLRQRQAFADGRDPDYVAALKCLSDEMRDEDIGELARAAALTPSSNDDEIVATLAELREEADRLDEYIEGHRELHSKRADRMNGLITLRRRYRERGFDRSNSIIDDQSHVNRMLSEFTMGLISSERLWRHISKAQRFQQTRVSTGRQPGHIGQIRIPKMPRSLRIPRNVGRSGGFGGGGFRTKGGF
ncbi:MAG: hypothetical protein AAFV47_10010 [Pseudomonadota bacterium]